MGGDRFFFGLAKQWFFGGGRYAQFVRKEQRESGEKKEWGVNGRANTNIVFGRFDFFVGVEEACLFFRQTCRFRFFEGGERSRTFVVAGSNEVSCESGRGVIFVFWWGGGGFFFNDTIVACL